MSKFAGAAAAMIVAAVLGSAGAASATVLDFDDIGVPNSTFGLNSNFVERGYQFSSNTDVVDIGSGSSWDQGGGQSGRYAALDDYTGQIAMTQVGGGTFSFDSFYIRGWLGYQGADSVTGYLNGSAVGTVNYGYGDSWTQVIAGFGNVDRVVFNDSGSSVVLVDTVSVNQGVPGAVPEPGVWAMLIAGFGMVGAAMRRRRLALA